MVSTPASINKQRYIGRRLPLRTDSASGSGSLNSAESHELQAALVSDLGCHHAQALQAWLGRCFRRCLLETSLLMALLCRWAFSLVLGLPACLIKGWYHPTTVHVDDITRCSLFLARGVMNAVQICWSPSLVPLLLLSPCVCARACVLFMYQPS